MSGNHWWDDYGSFRPWKICPTRPDPGEVVQFYLNKRGIEPEEQITYLIDLLDLQKSMVYNILTGISRHETAHLGPWDGLKCLANLTLVTGNPIRLICSNRTMKCGTLLFYKLQTITISSPARKMAPKANKMLAQRNQVSLCLSMRFSSLVFSVMLWV